MRLFWRTCRTVGYGKVWKLDGNPYPQPGISTRAHTHTDKGEKFVQVSGRSRTVLRDYTDLTEVLGTRNTQVNTTSIQKSYPTKRNLGKKQCELQDDI